MTRGRPPKKPAPPAQLSSHPNMREQLSRQTELAQVLAAALVASDRIEFCHRLSLSWPTARRFLWRHRSEVLEQASSRLSKAQRELATNGAQLDKAATMVRESEIGRLQGLWAVRYLNGF